MIRHALILAAGRGERMRPLTDQTPKPLLEVGGKRLIEWQLEKLAACGVTDVVINTSHLAEQFPAALGTGERWNLRIAYSYEGDQPLETGGGMLHALPLLGEQPFVVVNGDVWSDFDFSRLPANLQALAHLVLVDNPAQHADGDFAVKPDGLVVDHGDRRLTYSGIGVYSPALLSHWRHDLAQQEHPWDGRQPPRFALVHVLRAAMRTSAVTGEHHHGRWTDVGTPQRLAELAASITPRSG